MLEKVGVRPLKKDGLEFQSMPYNMLVTNDWMMVVPRTKEHFQDISINALGFAGSLFVRDQNQLEQIKQYGPINVLQSVALRKQ